MSLTNCTGGEITSLQVNNTDCSCVSISRITWNSAGTQFTIVLSNGQSLTSPVLTGATGSAPTVVFRVLGTELQYSVNGAAYISIYDFDSSPSTFVLYNPQVTHNTTGTALETLDSYTLPAGTLASDGSYIKVRAEFIANTANVYGSTKSVGLYFGGNNITNTSYQLFVNNCNKLILEATINRFSYTVVKNELDVIAGVYSGGFMYLLPNGVLNYFGGSMTSLNLTTTAYVIAAKADGIAVGDITLQNFCVTIFKK